MGRKSELTIGKIYISINGGPDVLWDSLTEAEKDECRAKMKANFAKAINEYYNAHPDEFAKLPFPTVEEYERQHRESAGTV